MQRYTKPQAPAIPLQSHESQQVTQLKILKGLEMAGKSLEQPPATQAPTTTTTTTTTTPSPTTAAVCGRFQFQCHSGECIAIYNACDGIPQCEDGSDETPAVRRHLLIVAFSVEHNIIFFAVSITSGGWSAKQ